MRNRSKGITLAYLHTAVNMACGLVLSSFLLRVLGDTEYGIYQTVASFANCLVLLEFGMGTVVVRNVAMCRGRMASPDEIQRNISTIWTLTSGLCLVMAAMIIPFYLLTPTLYAESMTAEQIAYAQKILIFIAAYLVLSFLSQTLNGVVLAFEHYAYGPIQTTIRVLVRTLLIVVLLSAYRYAILIAVIDVVVNGACMVYSYWFCNKKLGLRLRLGVCDRTVFRSALPLCFAIFLQAIVNQANNNVAKLVIGIQMSPESVALYSVSLYILSIFSSLTTIPVSLYAPAVTHKVAQGLQNMALAKELVTPCRLTALIGGMVLFGFIAVGRQFITLLYGAEYLEAWLIAIILMIPVYINMVNGVLVNVLDALNKRLSRSLVLIVSACLNIVLTVFLLEKWGIIGAAAAMAVSTFLGQVLAMNMYYKKVIGIPVLWLFAQAFRGIWAYLAMGCVAALALRNAVANELGSFLLCGVVFVLIASGGYLCFGMADTEKEMLMKLVKKGDKRGQ